MTWSNLTEGSRHAMSTVMNLSATSVLIYFMVVNTILLALIGLAFLEFLHHRRRKGYVGPDQSLSSQLGRGVSIVVPTFNQEAVIVTSVQAMLALHYPRHEVIVVDDGSTDATFERLKRFFDLVAVPTQVPSDLPTRGAIIDVSVPRDGRTPLTVVRKENAGRADTTNVGINAAAEHLVAIAGPDLILEPNALLEVARPFAEDPARVVASGGVIRAGNGCRVLDGRVAALRVAKTWIVRIQVVEYLRVLLVGRSGWSRLGASVLVSGAFNMFARAVLVEVGGYDPDATGADFDLMMRIHRHMIEKGRDHGVHFVAVQASWRDVPVTLKALHEQRRAWHRGVCETLWECRGMVFRPHCGVLGLGFLPFCWAVEIVAPLLELAVLVLVGTGVALAVVPPGSAVMFLAVVYGYATLVSLVTVAAEELSFHTYPRWRDLGAFVLASVVENFGYRQLMACWRLEGLWASLRADGELRQGRTRRGADDDSYGLAVINGDG